MLKLLIFMSLLSVSAQAQVFKIAVVDTSLTPEVWNNKVFYHLCPDGHKDYTGRGIVDIGKTYTHGSEVIKIINSNAKDEDYCITYINAYDLPTGRSYFVQAFDYIADQGNASLVNISGGGDNYYADEHRSILRVLDRGIKVVAAAGNGQDLLDVTPYYPACLDERIIVVANRTSSVSNIGSQVDYIVSESEWGATSMAAAKVTGLLVHSLGERWKSH